MRCMYAEVSARLARILLQHVSYLTLLCLLRQDALENPPDLHIRDTLTACCKPPYGQLLTLGLSSGFIDPGICSEV